MFDRLIASESAQADVKNRRRYFMVSSVVVGILFTAAVVVSIFAADYGLGSTTFELTTIIAPTETIAVEPETPQPRLPTTANQSQDKIAQRQVNMASVNEPTIAPTTVSTTQNTQISRPSSVWFIIGDRNSDPAGTGSSGREISGSQPETGGLTAVASVHEDAVETELPPLKSVPPIATKPLIQSLGVINGKALYLPKPVYSAAAIAIQAEGKVVVQVMIDENGKVISASAVSGHVMLRDSAERAARSAKFTTTYLSKVPVKVTGVIVYNFTR